MCLLTNEAPYYKYVIIVNKALFMQAQLTNMQTLAAILTSTVIEETNRSAAALIPGWATTKVQLCTLH